MNLNIIIININNLSVLHSLPPPHLKLIRSCLVFSAVVCKVFLSVLVLVVILIVQSLFGKI